MQIIRSFRLACRYSVSSRVTTDNRSHRLVRVGRMIIQAEPVPSMIIEQNVGMSRVRVIPKSRLRKSTRSRKRLPRSTRSHHPVECHNTTANELEDNNNNTSHKYAYPADKKLLTLPLPGHTTQPPPEVTPYHINENAYLA
jgi:hypothetical protein